MDKGRDTVIQKKIGSSNSVNTRNLILFSFLRQKMFPFSYCFSYFFLNLLFVLILLALLFCLIPKNSGVWDSAAENLKRPGNKIWDKKRPARPDPPKKCKTPLIWATSNWKIPKNAKNLLKNFFDQADNTHVLYCSAGRLFWLGRQGGQGQLAQFCRPGQKGLTVNRPDM